MTSPYWRRARSWLARLARVGGGSRTDQEIAEELDAHRTALTDEYVRSGMSPDEARRRAMADFGSLPAAVETYREQRGVRWIEDGWRDIQLAGRGVTRWPLFASAIIVTLALAIAANAAVFSIVSGVLLRPLNHPHPEQLMYIDSRMPAFPRLAVSVAEYLEFQQFNHAFTAVGAYRTGETTLGTGDRAVRVRSATVDTPLLRVLGLRVTQGRLFDDAATGVGPTSAEVVISEELWRSVFAGRAVIGKTVAVAGRSLQIVGIMAHGASLVDAIPDVWLPLAFPADELLQRNNHNLLLVGRLKDGVSVAAAQRELDQLIDTWGARVGITPGGQGHAGHVLAARGTEGDGHVLRITPLVDQILGRAGRAIWMLQVAVGLVVIVACANLMNLLLARAEQRRREYAVRLALGASIGRLIRQTMAETVILALAGGTLGVLVARMLVAAVVRLYPSSLPRFAEVAVDAPVAVVSLALAILCGVVLAGVAMLPVRTTITADIIRSGRDGSPGPARRGAWRALVATEVALAIVVAVGAGLLWQTLHNLIVADSGFERAGLVTFSLAVPQATGDPQTTLVGIPNRGPVVTYQRVLDRLRVLPGVHGASATTALPLAHQLDANQTEIANSTTTSDASVPTVDYYQRVMSDYFDTMGISIVQGRGFESTDVTSGAWTVVVNQAFADAYWTGLNPIGQQLRPCCGGERWFTVIGVAANVTQGGVDTAPGAEVWFSIDQLATDSPTTWVAFSPTLLHVVLRTTRPSSALAATIERVVRDIDPAVSVARVRDMDDVFATSIQRPKLLALLLTSFAVLAVALAILGTYAVLVFVVARSRREWGIRLALGASRRRILWGVLAQGLRPVALGVVLGAVVAAVLGRLVASLLFEVGPIDAATFLVVMTAFGTMAAVACWLPACRAARLDPNVVLRDE